MDEVAEASGVGKGTLYRYFPSKRDLFLAVTFDGIEELHVAVEAIAAAQKLLPGRSYVLGNLVSQWAAKDPAAAIAYVELRLPDGSTLYGAGIDKNIVVASLKAVVSGVNRVRKNQ